MGSGLGKFQKRIMAVLEELLPDTLVSDLGREVYSGQFSSAQYANLTAALNSLERRGLVECYAAPVPDKWWPEKHSTHAAVRLPSDAPRRWPENGQRPSTPAMSEAPTLTAEISEAPMSSHHALVTSQPAMRPEASERIGSLTSELIEETCAVRGPERLVVDVDDLPGTWYPVQ